MTSLAVDLLRLAVAKFNPNHDAKGLFSSGGGAATSRAGESGLSNAEMFAAAAPRSAIDQLAAAVEKYNRHHDPTTGQFASAGGSAARGHARLNALAQGADGGSGGTISTEAVGFSLENATSEWLGVRNPQQEKYWRIVDLRSAKLVAGQSVVSIERVRPIIDDPAIGALRNKGGTNGVVWYGPSEYHDFPAAAEAPNGALHVQDGHHRLAAAMLRGDTSIGMYVSPMSRKAFEGLATSESRLRKMTDFNLAKFNPNHHPPGSSRGGKFAQTVAGRSRPRFPSGSSLAR